MIESTALLLMIVGALSLAFAALSGIVHLITVIDPRPPRAPFMREEYRK